MFNAWFDVLFFVLDVFNGDRKAWIIVSYKPFNKKLLGIWLTPEKKDHVIACLEVW